MGSVFFVSTFTGSVLEVSTLTGSVFFVSTFTGSVLEVSTLMGSVFSVSIFKVLVCGALEVDFMRSVSALAAAFFFWSLFFAIFILLCLSFRISIVFRK